MGFREFRKGATDREIHDTVLIAAAFCMFNRYVDGLATAVPDDPAQCAMSAAHLVKHGYTSSSTATPRQARLHLVKHGYQVPR